jgi:CubicO group peptidase (beta-lactamase class C family)
VENIWHTQDSQVASGRIPGYVAAVRIGDRSQVRVGDRSQVRVGGRMAVAQDSPPMTQDTLFRIASLTKPIGGVLTLSLVEDGVLELDDPIARWLPEAGNPRVLVDPAGSLEHTVEAVRPITVRHLLDLTCGWGCVLDRTPLQAAMLELGVFPGPLIPAMSGDEFAARVASLPLAFQPGEGWLYDTGIDLLGVLLSRACGRPLSELVAERITEPLGMFATGFGARESERLATAYRPEGDRLEVLDPPDGQFAGPPRFEELSSGLVSTGPDLLRFFCAMADGGEPVLKPGSLARMTADALNEDQRRQARAIVGAGASWGLGTGVDVEAAEPWMAAGRWGWTGGTGTTAHVDPSRGTVAVLLTQRMMTGPEDGFDGFWSEVAIAASRVA